MLGRTHVMLASCCCRGTAAIHAEEGVVPVDGRRGGLARLPNVTRTFGGRMQKLAPLVMKRSKPDTGKAGGARSVSRVRAADGPRQSPTPSAGHALELGPDSSGIFDTFADQAGNARRISRQPSRRRSSLRADRAPGEAAVGRQDGDPRCKGASRLRRLRRCVPTTLAHPGATCSVERPGHDPHRIVPMHFRALPPQLQGSRDPAADLRAATEFEHARTPAWRSSPRSRIMTASMARDARPRSAGRSISSLTHRRRVPIRPAFRPKRISSCATCPIGAERKLPRRSASVDFGAIPRRESSNP